MKQDESFKIFCNTLYSFKLKLYLTKTQNIVEQKK